MICICNNRLPEEYRSGIRSVLDIEYFLEIPDNPMLYDSIKGHPDIEIFRMGDRITVSPFVYDRLLSHPALNRIEIVRGAKTPSSPYPKTVPYNAAVVGDFVITRYESCDDLVKEHISLCKARVLNVPQGYAGCSTVRVSETAVITADKSIYDAALPHIRNVLLIREGHILLPGKRYGFIGGTCGYLPERKLTVFTGDLSRHPDYLKIKEFFKYNGSEFADIPGLPLLDSGSLIFL